MPRGHEHNRNRSRFFKGQIVRNSAHVAGTRDRLCRQPEHSETEDPVARPNMRNIGSDGGNDTANFVSKDAPIGGLAGIKRESLEHVAKIHARRLNVDDYFARPARRLRKRDEPQSIELAPLT